MDGMRAGAPKNCLESIDEHVRTDAYKGGEKMTTGAAHAEFINKPDCAPQTYSREIVEVKVESDTRAIVLAKIKATTPIPSGATPDADDLKKREEGFPYKYLLEKVGSEWKIAQIYSYASYKDNHWDPLYTETPAPRVHSYIFGVQ
jgi:hypothetical protein